MRDLRRLGRRANLFGRGTFGGFRARCGGSRKWENEVSPSEKKWDFEHMPGCVEFMGERQKDVNKSNLLKKNKKIDTPKTHFTVRNLIFLKRQFVSYKEKGHTKLGSQW